MIIIYRKVNENNTAVANHTPDVAGCCY